MFIYVCVYVCVYNIYLSQNILLSTLHTVEFSADIKWSDHENIL